MNFWAYLLRCADGSYYTGHAEDLEQRVWQHQTGAMRGYTFTRRPVELVWSEAFSARADAIETEHRIKGWSRAKKEALIAENWDRLKKMAVPPTERRDRVIKASAALGIVPRLRSGRRENQSPVIVLVRAQLGENIGKAARAMLNFGLNEMRLVSPRDGWPNPSAGPASAGADVVLAQAQVFASVAEATADCVHVYATTVRKRGLAKPVVTPQGAAAEIRAAPGRSAILFGPERSGLASDDVALARSIITVPVNPEFGSLNLAQAVILIAYEWSKGEVLAMPPKTELDPPAPQEELEGLIVHLEALLEKARFFFPPERAHVTRRTVRSLLTKPQWTAQEVRTLRGVIRAIGEPHPSGKKR